MMDFATLGWTVGAAVWVIFALYVCSIAWRLRKDRLMRCPETGSITLVCVGPALRHAGKAPETQVQRCALWPAKMGCTRGCLARYEETSSGYKVNLDALRSFDRMSSDSHLRDAGATHT